MSHCMRVTHFVALVAPVLVLFSTNISCVRNRHAPLTNEEKQVYQTVQDGYKQQDAAFGRKDIEGFFAHYTSDFVDVNDKGQTADYAKVRETLMALFAVTRSVTVDSSIQDFVLKGDSAVVTVKEHGIWVMEDPLTHQTSQSEHNDTEEDVWIRTPRGWLIKSSRSL